MVDPLYRSPRIFQSLPGLLAAETTRHGGVSAPPYAALNLGKNTGDRPENIEANRRLLADALGFAPEQLAWSVQVHGDAVLVVEQAGGATGFDALLTNRPGIVLSVSVADCVPVLLYDRRNRAVAAIHAGWKGTARQLVLKSLKTMQTTYGTQSEDCLAYVGTCIDECSGTGGGG